MNEKIPFRFESLSGVSLFSGAGIGDLGFRASGVNFQAMCEFEPDRAALAEINYREARHFVDDINRAIAPLCDFVTDQLAQSAQELFLVTCTAPCQGMSKSGQGTLLNYIRQGKRPKLDPRNRLILPALKIISRLRPLWVVFENVIEMRNTHIEDERGVLRPILDIIQCSVHPGYVGAAYDIEFADYGVPQRRQRLITVYTRDPAAIDRHLHGLPFIPPRTHQRPPSRNLLPWVSAAEALMPFPPLDGKDASTAECPQLPFHRVPVLDPKKYEWIQHTPPGASAFDNQCINPTCGYAGNPTHGTDRSESGINRARKDTPLYCIRCGNLLPRPYTVEADGSKRIMFGYTSAYKRMEPSLPAPALTRNLSYPCSDNKIHPYQNRVLSLAEAMSLQTISLYPYKWGPFTIRRNGLRKKAKVATDALIRLAVAESVPPRFLELMGRYLRAMSFDESLPASDGFPRLATQLALL